MNIPSRHTIPVLIFFLPGILAGQTTWNQDIAPIMFDRCTACHHDGAIAPFSLMTYDEAVDHGFDIKNNVTEGIMPPWPPDETYVHFKDERVLSEEEINKIISWANDGFEEGSGYPPAPPVYTDESQLDIIDESFVLPTYTVVNEADEFRKFVIQTDYIESKFIEATEFLPGNGSIIHHMTLHIDTSDVSYLNDLDDPLPGFNADGTLMAPSLKLIGGWVPGGSMGKFPPGMAIELTPGSDLVIEIHYAPGSNGESATPVLNLKWSDDPSPRRVKIDRYLDYFPPCLQEEELFIPANTVQTFHQVYDEGFPSDISLISITPHMHYLGQNYLVYAIPPGSDTVPLIYVDDWDFHWQGTYTFQKLLPLVDGTVLYGVADYDNTIENEDNPSDPPVDVYGGGHTTDEMMSCYFTWVSYKEGDEDMILDSSIIATQVADQMPSAFIKLFPNPAGDHLYILNPVDHAGTIEIVVTDALGRELIQKDLVAATVQPLDISALAPGIYFIAISGKNFRVTEKFMHY